MKELLPCQPFIEKCHKGTAWERDLIEQQMREYALANIAALPASTEAPVCKYGETPEVCNKYLMDCGCLLDAAHETPTADSAEVEALQKAIADHVTVRGEYYEQIVELQERLAEAEFKLAAQKEINSTLTINVPEAQLSQRQQAARPDYRITTLAEYINRIWIKTNAGEAIDDDLAMARHYARRIQETNGAPPVEPAQGEQDE